MLSKQRNNAYMSKLPEEDAQWVKQFKSGTALAEQAFTALVNKYSRQLYWQIRRVVRNHEESNDILQNVWIKVWKNLSGFQEESSFFTWLYRISRNETLNFIQKERKNQAVDLDDAYLELVAERSEMQHVTAEQISLLLLNAVDTLPEKQALVFQLRYFDDMSYQEIAAQLGTSEGGLKANYHHAVQKIQEFLGNQLNL